jgi:succinyl-diaminopimelate desuccinylase
VRFLQALVRVPTDTPPGNNAPHAERTAELLKDFGFDAEKHAVPAADVQAYGMESITNLIVRRPYGTGGKTIALNAHGDVVPPGEGWTHDPYGAEIVDGKMYGRATAVSKSDFASFTFAVRALEAVARPRKGGGAALHLRRRVWWRAGPGWLLKKGLTKPDLMIAAGFSYEVVTAHNGCLQMEVTVHGKMAHAAVPAHRRGRTAGRGAHPECAVCTERRVQEDHVQVEASPPLPERGPHRGRHQHQRGAGQGHFQARPPHDPRREPGGGGSRHPPLITQAQPSAAGISVDIKRLLLANAMTPLAGNQPLVDAIQKHAQAVIGEPVPAVGTPLYTDVRLYVERGIPGVIYGAGPRTVLESHAKRADERLDLKTCAAPPR